MVHVENTGRGKLNLRYGVKLAPGVNDVDPESWDKCKVDPITQHYLQSQQIRVVSGLAPASPRPAEDPVPPPMPTEPELPDLPVSLEEMKAKEAIAFVKESDNYQALELMLEHENRSTVKAAIEDRLDELDPEE